jgi:hypothetical protein
MMPGRKMEREMNHQDMIRKVDVSLDWTFRKGGYLLPCVKLLAAEFPALTWEQLNLRLQAFGGYCGYAREAVQRSFEMGRPA